MESEATIMADLTLTPEAVDRIKKEYGYEGRVLGAPDYSHKVVWLLLSALDRVTQGLEVAEQIGNTFS
jgi:hypothetical protein